MITLELLADTPTNRARVQRLCEAAPSFSQLTENRLPQPTDGDEVFTALPSGYTAADLSVYAIRADDRDVGHVSFLRRWNAPHKAIIGLLLLAESEQGKGYGPLVFEAVRQEILREPQFTVLRIGVVQNNTRALRFWLRMGFVENGEIKESDEYAAPVVILERPVAPRV